LGSGGRIAFLTIITAPALTPSQRRQAVRAGPPALLTRRDHRSMLATAGFRDVEETDVTADYLSTVRAWSDQSLVREDELRQVIGDALFDDRERDRRLQVDAIEQGLLRRSLFFART
jgi:hypothetical protein